MNLMQNDEVDGRQFISSFSQQSASSNQSEFTNGSTNNNINIVNYDQNLQHQPPPQIKREYIPPAAAGGDVVEDGFNSCRRCGKAEYRNGEFATIKLGDIFTHITQFSSSTSSSSTSESLCSSCLKNNTGGNNESRHTTTINNNNVIKHFNNASATPSTSTTTTILSQQLNANTIRNNMHHLIMNNSSNGESSGVNVVSTGGNNINLIRLNHLGSTDNNFERSLGGNGLLTSSQQLDLSQIYRDNNNEAILINNQFPVGAGDPPTHAISNAHSSNELLFLSRITNESNNKVPHAIHISQNDVKPIIIPSHIQSSITANSNIVPIDNSNGTSFRILLGGGGSSGYATASSSISTGSENAITPNSSSKSSLKLENNNTKKSSLDNSAAPRVPCDLCKKTFKNTKMASIHLKRVHEKVNRFVCEICGIVFSYRGSLDSHLSSHNPPEVTHDCPTCGQKFKEKSNLNKHMRYHTDNPKKFLCEHCPSGFSKKVNLRYHVKRKHPEVAMNNNNLTSTPSNVGYSPMMVKTTTSTEGLGLNPTASLPSTVGDAPTTTTTKGQKSNTNGKDKPPGNFKCEQCGRGFLFKNNLKAHLRTHTRDKKYTCELCQKSFIYKESLKNHMLLHSNELPYLCDICGKKFRDRSNRRKHVKNVHKYMFVNGDINNPIRPTTGSDQLAGPSSSLDNNAPQQGSNSLSTNAAVPKKAKKRTKKSAAQQDNTTENPSSDQGSGDGNFRNIIKAPRAKKSKTSASTENILNLPPLTNVNNAKSVIVSASSGMMESALTLDRKIIMSPSPKNSTSNPTSPEYNIPHPPNSGHALPLSVRLGGSLAGSSGQFSHIGSGNGNRNIIVKAVSSTISSSSQQQPLSPNEMSMSYHAGGDSSRGPPPPMQNVIVYPKGKSSELPQQYQHHHLQQEYSPITSSQTMHRPHKIEQQQQYYPTYLQHQFNTDQSQIPSVVGSGGESGCYQYVLSSTNSSVPPEGSEMKLFGSPPDENVNSPQQQQQQQYSAIYHSEDPYHPRPHSHPGQQVQQHYWVTNLDPSADHGSSPYERSASSAGPHHGGGPPSTVSLVEVSQGSSSSYGGASHVVNPITAASNVLNAPSYGQPHASETILDPSTHGFYKDLSQFDFSYL